MIGLIHRYLTSRKRGRTLRLLTRRNRLRSGHPNWTSLLDMARARWQDTLDAAPSGPKVLIATSVGGNVPGTILESVLAVALTLRGADVHILLCDSALPACLETLVKWYPNQIRFLRHGPANDLCKECFEPAYAMFKSLGLPVHRYSEFLTLEERIDTARIASTAPFGEIGRFKLDGIAVGEHAMAGALRFYARGTLEGEPYAEPVLRRYLHASLLTTYAMGRLLEKFQFSCAAFQHGIYVPHGLIGEVCRKEKVRVANWNPAYRKKCFIFSHNDTYHHTLLSEPLSQWENLEWTLGMETELMEYLKSRWQGTEDWIWFHNAPQEDLTDISKELGVDFSKPCIGMLTNVMWDAQLHYPANAFPNMLQWVLETIRYFARRPELQLLIRVHPAEIRGTLPSRQPIVDEIAKVFPTLPKNVFLIPPGSSISTYAVMRQCDTIVIYGTKAGVELACIGIPVIVAGEAWIRNKGITMDAHSLESYFQLLDQLPSQQRLNDDLVARARKYAYHFFFRRMIPLEFFEPAPPTASFIPYTLNLESLKQLMPGASVGLDTICDGILHGTDFVYPAEHRWT